MKRENVVDVVKETKAVALYHGSFIFVGHPQYETIEEDTVMSKIVDVYQMIITAIPGQDRGGRIQVATNITGFRVGIVEPTDEHLVVELASNSELYEAYVAISSGIQKASTIQ